MQAKSSQYASANIKTRTPKWRERCLDDGDGANRRQRLDLGASRRSKRPRGQPGVVAPCRGGRGEARVTRLFIGSGVMGSGGCSEIPL